MSSLIRDAQGSAAQIADALCSSGYRVDFTLASLKEVDRFFDEHARDGAAVAGGLLSNQLGARLFALGAYVGEVIRRRSGGRWMLDGKNPTSEVDIQLVLVDGNTIWPIQRVMKRFKKGSEDGLFVFGVSVTRSNT